MPMKALHAMHALLTALLLLWGWWSFVALDKAFTQLYHLNRTMGLVVRELPEGNVAGSLVGWCIGNNPSADRFACPDRER
jgi:hypothetical protein